MTTEEIIALARARADADVAQGIIDLEAAIAVAPEWERHARTVVPAKALLEGMLEHLRESYAAQHPDEEVSA